MSLVSYHNFDRPSPSLEILQIQISPSLSMQPLSRYRSTQEPKRWPALLPVAFGAALVFPSHRSSDACCAYKIRASNNKSIIHTGRWLWCKHGFSFMHLREACEARPNIMCHFLKQAESTTRQSLTPRTPALHWSDWWSLGCCSWCSISLCSIHCHMSSREGPACKTKP